MPAEVRAARLDAQLVGREHIAEAWREATSTAYTCEPLTGDGFDASMIVYQLDGLTVSRVRFEPSRFTRTPAMLRDDESDGIAIGHYLSGSIRGRAGDVELHMAPDRISFQDLGVPCEGLATASEVLSAVIPRDRIVNSDRLRTRRPVVSLPLDTARGSLLAGLLRGLWDELCAGRVTEPAVVAGAFVGLANGLIDHSVEAPGDRQPQPLMEQYLRERLGDPTLGPEHLQHEFHYSRSAIYRLFEHHGGVAAFIRSERLRRCHAELIRSSAPLAVSSIAARYGFYDASHFSRAFRGRYGIAPSQLAAAAAEKRAERPARYNGGSANVSTIKSWLESL